jgi:DNA-binding SARP family transcriptional activator
VLTGTAGFLGRIAQGLLAAAGLLALVVMLPWALWHYVGWPLPDHLPTWAEIEGLLLGPMTGAFLLDGLACLGWIAWAAFSLEVLRCAVDLARSGVEAARTADWSAAGPVHALAGVLVGAVMVSVLGNRLIQAPVASASATPESGSQIVATATVSHHAVIGGGSADAGRYPASVTVLSPHNGVHDSLWRIAQRTLGDGGRWPEIFELNKGKPQPNGHRLTTPSLIFPGEELALPSEARLAAAPPQQPADPDQSSPPPPSAPPPTATSVPPSTGQTPPETVGTHSKSAEEPGFRWGAELFVGLGLAAAISAALKVARYRYRSRYRPGSGDRDDLPVAPVVYQLRLAHLRAEQTDSEPAQPPLMVGAPTSLSPTLAPGLGVRDGHEVALNLAAARGLGLVGAGATAAARALLMTMLATATEATLFIPADDLTSVLGRETPDEQLPSALRVVAGLDAALDVVEAEILVRASAGRDRDTEPGTSPPLVLVTRPPAHHRRLQAVLDNGAQFGVTGLVLGQWQPGVTVYVRQDGTVSASGPGLGEALRGTRMFRLGGDDAADMLDLLRQAKPQPIPPDTSYLAVPLLAPHARTAGTSTAENDRRVPSSEAPPEAGRSSAVDLEVTAAVEHTAPSTSRLEILAPSPAQSLQVRLQTPAAEIPSASTTSREDNTAGVHITVTVLGGLRVHWHPEPGCGTGLREITGALQPRTQELLVLLALHPEGVTRDALVSALWGQDPPVRPTNALHTALSRIRAALASATGGAVSDIVSVTNGRYQLDPAIVDVDYWHFARAVTARRTATTDQARIDAYRDVLNAYSGALADGMSAEWIEPVREAIRRDAIDAVAALARALVDTDPQQTLDLLEIARAFDPHNELLYRDIMRLQERLGQLDAIPRTLTLLTTRLAEVDATPTPQARGLAEQLRQRHENNLVDTGSSPTWATPFS